MTDADKSVLPPDLDRVTHDTIERCQMLLLLSALFFVFHGSVVAAQTQPITVAAAQTVAGEHDSLHDFDFAIGTWKIHLSRLDRPLTGSKKWIEFDGTLVAQKLWDGRANIEEVELNSPTGPIEGLTLRLYNAQSHQWSIYWANSKNGSVDASPQV